MNIKSLFAVLLLAATSASATTIEFTATNINNNRWQYDYTVANDTLGFAIEEFTIYFDLALYDNLTIAASPAGWDSLVIQSDPNIPADGFFDSLALVTGIAPGDTLGSFSVWFDYFGNGTPGAQNWDVVDPISFATLDQGVTQAGNIMPAPEPPTLALLLLGLLTTMLARARR